MGYRSPTLGTSHLVETAHFPTLGALVGHGFDIAVETDLKFVRLSAVGGCHTNKISPDDRAGMPESRDSRFPKDILTGLSVPTNRRPESVCNTTGAWATELRPLYAQLYFLSQCVSTRQSKNRQRQRRHE
jgi:hypothetical protein